MKFYEILIIIVCAVFVLSVLIASFIRFKKGKTCCDCSNCPSSCCNRRKEQSKNKINDKS